MSTDNIEKLYKHFGILADAKDKISEHEKEYLGILTAVKGSAKEKRLASQFIARFFKHFPKLADQAIEAQLDLCEDEDVAIRKQAIKDLPSLCKDNKEHTQKISDILAQLLQAEDNSELSIVHTALVTLFKVDAKGSLAGIFSQILSGDDLVRERCFKFLSSKVKSLGHEVIPKGAEDFLIEQSKKVLQDVSAEEFHRLMDLLGWTRLGQTIAGQQELVDLVAEQADIGQDFDPKDPENENVDRLIQCFKHSLPYFSSQVNSGRFVAYMCEQVMPRLDEIRPREETDLTLEVLRLFAELTIHAGTLETAPACVENVFNRLLAYMPLPPDTDGPEEPRLEFSHVECLIYSLHQLGRQSPEVLTRDPDTLKDFRFRLQYFARGIQGYIKKLRDALQGKTAEELKSDENRIKVVALKTTSNINTLIKDLFHSPPSYKSSVSLSWKPTTGTAKVADTLSPGQKRHTPITFSSETSPNKTSRMDKSQRELYQPPSGKYSNKVSSYVPSQMRGRGGGRWRGRGGGFRGNRGWRRNY